MLLACAAVTSANVLNLICACADESSNADDMVDILELVPETIRAAVNAHLDSMNSLYPIRSVVASCMLSLQTLNGGVNASRQSAGGLLAVHAKAFGCCKPCTWQSFELVPQHAIISALSPPLLSRYQHKAH